jgi:hypothetical protein
LMELASRAHELFQSQPPSEKRRLLNFVLSNCSWKGGELSAKFRQPFDMLAFTSMSQETKEAARGTSGGPYKNWLPFVNALRTLCLAPPPEVKVTLGQLHEWTADTISHPRLASGAIYSLRALLNVGWVSGYPGCACGA